jgi:hypothetical protein
MVVERPQLEALLEQHPLYFAELDEAAGASLNMLKAAA